MNQQKPSRLVPFPGFFGPLGYAIVSFIVLCLIAEGGAKLVLKARERLGRALPEEWKNIEGHCRGIGDGKCSAKDVDMDAASANPDYAAFPWADAYWREERARLSWWWDKVPYEPFVIWSNNTLAGRFINVDPTESGRWRRTGGGDCGGHPEKTIWFFGGSAAWGYGSPDEWTIPSRIAARLKQSGHCVRIINMAVEGYVSSQEVIVLEQELRAGRRPDIAIFFDGYNDADSGSAQSDIATGHLKLARVKLVVEGRHQSALRGWLDRSSALRVLRGLLKRVHAGGQETWETVDREGRVVKLDFARDPDPKLAPAVLQVYARNRELVRLMGERWGFQAYFFWQPALRSAELSNLQDGGYTAAWLRYDDSPGWRSFAAKAIAQVYAEAERRAAADGFIYLGHVFDRTTHPVFIDSVHLSPQGNEIIAEQVVKTLQSQAAPAQR